MRLLAAAICLVLAGCGSSKNWLIKSYDSGVITVSHEGQTFRAVCESHISQDTEHRVKTEPSCRTAIDYVGKELQPYGSERREPNGTIVAMLHSGKTLGIRIWRDEHSAWEAEYFTIESVN